MKKYTYHELTSYHYYYVVLLDYEYPNDNEHCVEFTRTLGIVTQAPQTVEAVLAEYFTGQPLDRLSDEEIADLSPKTQLKMVGAALMNTLDDTLFHDDHGCLFSVRSIEEISFEQFNTLKKYADMKIINVVF